MFCIGRTASADQLQDERTRAFETAARIEAEWPLLGPGPVSDFVDVLGARLAEHAPAAPFPWRFIVFRHRDANAFAIGGGRIYVSDGTVRTSRCEAEMAAILAHEMGHELAGHFRPGQVRDRSGPGRGAGHVRIGSVMQELDPAHEIEADRISVDILRAAGYAPRAALDVAKRLSGRHSAGSTPRDSARLAALTSVVRKAPPEGRFDTAEFQRLRAELIDVERE